MYIFVIFTGRDELVLSPSSTAPGVGDPGRDLNLRLAAWSGHTSTTAVDGCSIYSSWFSEDMGVVGTIIRSLGSPSLISRMAVSICQAGVCQRTLLFNRPIASSLVTPTTCDSQTFPVYYPSNRCLQ